MFSLSIRSLLSHKLRFLSTTFAVVLGVGFVVGAFVVTDTLGKAVDELFEGISSEVDVSVRASTDLESGFGGVTSRGRVPLSLAPELAAVDGVDGVAPQLSGYAQLLDKQGEPMATTGAPLLGVNWTTDERLNPATIERGRAPTAPGEVAIDRGTADDFGFAPGARTQMLTIGGPRDVEVVGVFTFGASNSLLGARLTAMETAWADEVLGAGGLADTIDLVAEPGVGADELATRVRAVLPPGTEAVTGRTVIDEGTEQVGGFLTVFQTVLLAFAGIALFVSAFFINNTFSILLGQRVRELSLLRALGATGGQVLRSVMLEAIVIGLLASVLGVGFGLLIAGFLQGVLAAGGFDLPAESLALEGRTVVAALVVGLPVTVVSALPPARRAARVAPLEGMRAGFVPGEGTQRGRLIVGSTLTIVGAALLLVGLFVLDGTAPVFASLAVGALGVFGGVALLSPLAAVPAARVLGWPVARLGGSTGRLARANAMRNPHRTAKTASALMIGLALVTTAFVVGESLKRSFADAVEGAVTADFVVSGGGFTGFSPKVAEDLRALPEIDAATGVRFDRFRFQGQDQDVVAVDPTDGAAVIDIGLEAGDFAALGPDSILIHRDPARDQGLQVGDQVEVSYASGGPRQVRIAGIYGDATFAGNYLMDLDTFTELYPFNNLDFFVFATVTEGVDPAVARAKVEEVVASLPQLEVQSRAEFNQSQQDQLDQILLAVNGLLGLALVIALLGIGNTLALSVVERTHEIGLLRAVGMRRRQVRTMVLTEALVVALFGAVLGVSVGLVFGLGAASAMPPSVITRIAVPAGSLVAVVVVAALFGIVAGVLPARRAARFDILEAIAVE